GSDRGAESESVRVDRASCPFPPPSTTVDGGKLLSRFDDVAELQCRKAACRRLGHSVSHELPHAALDVEGDLVIHIPFDRAIAEAENSTHTGHWWFAPGHRASHWFASKTRNSPSAYRARRLDSA